MDIVIGSTRNLKIDYLKFIALIGLVLAHVSDNVLILQIRSFDVNLLVILSAMLMANKEIDINKNSILKFYKKRIIRLLFPTWIFLSFYFLINYYFTFQTITYKEVLKTYLLLNTPVGYVWIVYVYIVCALITPLIIKIRPYKYNSHLVLLFLAFCLYNLLAKLNDNYYYRILFLYPIIYGIIMIIGFNWNYFSKRFKFLFIVSNIIIYILISFYYYNKHGIYILTGEFKYPPRLYYLSYSIGVSLLLYELINKISLSTSFIDKICVFYSKFSLWFYLWHILVLQIAKRVTNIDLLMFCFVMIVTSLIIYTQSRIVNFAKLNGVNPKIYRLFVG